MRLLIIILFILSCPSAVAQNNKYKIACIGFYNLENLFDTINQPDVNDDDFTPEGADHYTGDVYRDKLKKLERVISGIGKEEQSDGLALLGVAEVENSSVLHDLAAQPLLKDRNLQIIHYDSPDERGIDVGLLYNPLYFKPKKSEQLSVDIRNPDGSPDFTRDVLYVGGLLDGEPVHLFINHWPSRRGGEQASAKYRFAAAKVARTKIDSILTSNPSAKIILMGDLNDDPVSESVTNVLKATGDTSKASGMNLYNPWVEYYRSGTGTLVYNDAWNLFDQIIISPQWLNKDKGFYFREAKIYRKEYMINQSGRYKGYPKRTYNFNKYIGGYSDHLPTYIVLLKQITGK